MAEIGKYQLFTGFVLVILGGILWLGVRIPGAGRLPGDIHVEKETSKGRISFYFPLATGLVLSIILTLLLNLLIRLWR